MIIHLLKTTFRSFLKYRIHSFINVTSLALGIFVIILITAYVRYEKSFDSFYKNKNQIYRLEYNDDRSLAFPAPLYERLKTNVPEIKNITRIGFVFADWMLGGDGTLTYNENTFSADDVLCADPEFFDIFQFRAINGDLSNALVAPMSIVLTESEARRIFGNENPVGKTITGNEIIPFNVTAVIEDVPANSSLTFKSMISFSSLKAFYDRNIDNNWGSWNYLMYAQLYDNVDIEDVSSKIKQYTKPDMPVEYVKLNPLSDIYFNALQTKGVIKHGNKQQIILFIAIATIILIIGIINYINLTNAKFIYRINEISVRKIIGALKKQIINQILFETIFTLLIATAISLVLISIFGGYLGNFLNIQKLNERIFTPTFISCIVLSVIALGLLTGLYPSLFLLNRANLSKKKDALVGKKKYAVQNSLVVFQFWASIILIASVFLIQKQMSYIKNKDIGFAKESVIQFSLPNNLTNERFNLLKQSLITYPGIIDVGRSKTIPGKSFPDWTWTMNLNGEEKNVTFLCIMVDDGFINSLGLEIVSGRNFNPNIEEDIGDFIINEKFFSEYGVDTALTTTLSAVTNENSILGVVKDFNAESLHMPVQPLAFRYVPQSAALGIVRFTSAGQDNVNEIIQHLGKVWNDMGYKKSLDYVFLEDSINNLYSKERKLHRLLILFGLFALIVSLVGLWGLTMLTIKLRTKEIGIRKVNGAKISEVMVMLNKDFVKRVTIAFVIATPVAWFAMNKWLENFAYKTTLSWWIFALAGLLALGIALLTVSWQSWRAATRNPVEALRYE